MMKNIAGVVSISLFLVLLYSSAQAKIVVGGSNDFERKIDSYLEEAQASSIHLKKLINSAVTSTITIKITPITDNPATWHAKGKKSRSHTEAIDNKKRGSQRNKATSSIVYINVNRITQSHKSYKSGTLIHELVHALDLARGKYHKKYSIREKRAVFFQNIWRKIHGKKLRSDYHGRFETLEYQNAVLFGRVEKFVNYYYANNDIP